MNLRPGNQVSVYIRKVTGSEDRYRRDHVATEEPMEIRVVTAGETRTVAVTMRTPGNDFELAAGFLYSEGVISGPNDIQQISYCTDPDVQQYNVVNVNLKQELAPDFAPLERHFYSNSSCGVCGKASLESLQLRNPATISTGPTVPIETVYQLPGKLRGAQGVYEKTGGLHASGLFNERGELIATREDVGRHNALDKLIGWALMQSLLPLADHMLMVSGRTSYEIMQKSVMAGIPIVAAVSAPSSLAVDMAREFDITLIGFLREQRCNIYSGYHRVIAPSSDDRAEIDSEERSIASR